MEIWKKINGFENYEISNLGRVKSLEKKTSFGVSCKIYPQTILKNWIDKKGYCYVDLRNNNKRTRFLVHRLVCFNFLGNPENKPQVNHINGIKLDNRLENLEWNTCKENINHAIQTGLNNISGVNNYRSKLTKEQVNNIRVSNLAQKELSVIYNISQASVSRIILKKTYKNGQ